MFSEPSAFISFLFVASLMCVEVHVKAFLFPDINSQIHGHGYGGQTILEGTEEVNFEHMVICKNEVILYLLYQCMTLKCV